MRQGKGILATFLSLYLADMGVEVLSNYWLDSPNAKVIGFYDLLDLLQKPRQEPQKLIVLDEIQGWLDSYVGQSKGARFGSYFIFQSAKLGYDVIYTTQLTMRAMNTLRELCDLRMTAVKDTENKQFNYHLLDINEPDDDIPTGQVLTIPFSVAQLFWNRYNTYEGVEPIGLEEILTSLVKFDIPRMDKTINQQVNLLHEKLKQEGNTRIISKVAVESLLISLGQPTTFAPLVTHRLKEQIQHSHKQASEKQLSLMSHEQPKVSYKQGWLELKKVRGL